MPDGIQCALHEDVNLVIIESFQLAWLDGKGREVVVVVEVVDTGACGERGEEVMGEVDKVMDLNIHHVCACVCVCLCMYVCVVFVCVSGWCVYGVCDV